ncbi:uncharacterized protein EI90DRAFT_3056904 [Cantharellus anzutake]|uniref:uncharacterized protein n=1 Tax=Cantharellus anzutake TaxID=1750568 RepID=UPI001907BB51|nr:uncharacterized protein EI90DRAFT_3093363 [Cantharellus anzutake]XP_038916282.1 uncharacterized protein EI90DRAFT_3056904 [Cantharellus anzutake]KAF8312571.1 hypothetical protein EI90DRAFT_3093363 [Cantharellus anzutake]KAF8331672.1 hypothetical protein EI90DRAFT_3056904 [Cantharellus anzutake]
MQYKTLRLNTRYNIFPLGAAVRGMLDRGYFVLVPEQVILDAYKNAVDKKGKTLGSAKRGKFPSFNKTDVFKYELLPIDNAMDHIALLIQDAIRERAAPSDFTVHTTPFDNLPVFTSHVRL